MDSECIDLGRNQCRTVSGMLSSLHEISHIFYPVRLNGMEFTMFTVTENCVQSHFNQGLFSFLIYILHDFTETTYSTTAN